jgi:hypothetical protein
MSQSQKVILTFIRIDFQTNITGYIWSAYFGDTTLPKKVKSEKPSCDLKTVLFGYFGGHYVTQAYLHIFKSSWNFRFFKHPFWLISRKIQFPSWAKLSNSLTQRHLCFYKNCSSQKKIHFLKFSSIFFLFTKRLETLHSEDLVVPTMTLLCRKTWSVSWKYSDFFFQRKFSSEVF